VNRRPQWSDGATRPELPVRKLGVCSTALLFACSTAPLLCFLPSAKNGGGEIRTHGTLAGPPVFKTGAFGRSATPPG
jgi:hypothetical protein